MHLRGTSADLVLGNLVIGSLAAIRIPLCRSASYICFHYQTFNSRITSFNLRHHQPVHTAYRPICIVTTRIFLSATGFQLGQQPFQLNSTIHPASPFRFMDLSGAAFLFGFVVYCPVQRFIWFRALVCVFLLSLIRDITRLYMLIGLRCFALLLSWEVFLIYLDLELSGLSMRN